MSNQELETLTTLQKGNVVKIYFFGDIKSEPLIAQVEENFIKPESIIQWGSRLKDEGLNNDNGCVPPKFVSAYGSVKFKATQKPNELSSVNLDPFFTVDVQLIWNPSTRHFQLQCRLTLHQTIALNIKQIEICSS